MPKKPAQPAAVHRKFSEALDALVEQVKRDRSVLASLLAVMIAGGDGALVEYVGERLRADPPVAQERYSGRALLHGAAAVGQAAERVGEIVKESVGELVDQTKDKALDVFPEVPAPKSTKEADPSGSSQGQTGQ